MPDSVENGTQLATGYRHEKEHLGRIQAGEPLVSCHPLRADDCGPTIDAMAMVDMRGA